jgi:hypothetical protein
MNLQREKSSVQRDPHGTSRGRSETLKQKILKRITAAEMLRKRRWVRLETKQKQAQYTSERKDGPGCCGEITRPSVHAAGVPEGRGLRKAL